MRLEKSNEKSKLLRIEGNNFYKEKKFHDAIVQYNKSLCASASDSEDLGHAFANRSAICFELRLYEKCLKNISLARLHNYPKESIEILKSRERKCREKFIGRHSKSTMRENYFKLSYKCHDKIPHIIDSLEMKMSEKFGRHIVTRKDLNVGDILVVEEPFCSVLLAQSKFVDVDRDNYYLRCCYCLKSNAFELIPCAGCCSVMFCEECYSKAHDRFHKYECPVIDQLLLAGSVHIALRIFFIALSAFDGSIEKLKMFMQEIDKKEPSTIFDAKSDTKSYLRVLNSLARSEVIFPLIQHEAILESHPDLSEMWAENRTFIRDFLQRQCQTNDHYFHGIFGATLREPNSKDIKNIQQSIGSGWFPFCSLINHSCSSNVMRIYVDGKVTLVASRFIPSGSQLFDCYRTNFISTQKSERQLRLQREFGFICDCEACEGNFPTLPGLSIKNVNLARVAKKMEEELLSTDDLQKNLKHFRECCRLIKENRDNFPCVELVLLQKCFALYLLLQARNR